MTSEQGKPSMVIKLRMCARLAALACGAFLLAGAPAQAQSGGVFDSMLGLLGLKSDEQPNIEYRERAPLVVPPQIKLRTPEPPAAARTAAWPNDPDVARRAAEEKYRKTPMGERPDRKYLEGELRKPGDIPGGRTYGKTPTEPRPFVVEGSLAESGWVSPDKLRAMGPKAQEQSVLVAGEEPPRRYLTDPPAGMRVPSGKAPLTAGKSLAKPRMNDKQEGNPLNTYLPQPKAPDDE
jgi:hypothetical protein